MKPRILIADDHDVVRRGLRALIEHDDSCEVCGEAADGRDALAMAEKLKPDLAVIDIGMPGLNGIELTRQIKRSLPETEILIFTGHDSETLVHQLFAAGARGCVLKSDAGNTLLPAIRAVCARQPFFSSRVSELVFDAYLHGGAPPEKTGSGLTPREREIVQLLAEGKSNKDVANLLGIAVKTAETHRAAIMRKLKLKAFSELVRYAVRNHLVAS